MPYAYSFVLLFLLFGLFVEMYTHRPQRQLFAIAYGLMTAMATFRYGQFGDYFAYEMIYKFPQWFTRDLGYFLLASACSRCGVSYEVFAASVSFGIMLLCYRFFAIDCKRSFIALIVFFGYSFLWTAMGAIRQGIALGLILMVFVPMARGHVLRFYAFTAVACLFHLSAIIAFTFPLIVKLKFFNHWKMWIFIGGGQRGRSSTSISAPCCRLFCKSVLLIKAPETRPYCKFA